MIKCEIKFFILIFIYSEFINCNNDSGNQNDDKTAYNENLCEYNLELEKSQIIYLNYSKINHFIFENINNDLLVNFHSIDCDIDISNINNSLEVKAQIFEINRKRNIYSLLIKKIEKVKIQFLVETFINSDNDEYIDYRECPVVINSYYISKPKINITSKESMILNFIENFSTIELSYNIKNLTENKDSFMILSFKFDENAIFNVDIENNTLNRDISYSSNIFLFYDDLSKNEKNILTINIECKLENCNSLLIFKIFESNSISILEKNKLSIGFTNSKKVNQYYYLEVFKGEEGEIMLHNKRLYGELYGIIKSKSEINKFNKTVYANKREYNQLQFNANTRKLSFNLSQTKQCEEGCYLLLTYSHDDYYFNSTVGFEYTLLTRIWNVEEIGSEIINIPFNEYIFGVFEENSINHHYYSLFIPNNTKEIIVQFEGNYVEGFMGTGIRKLNTFRELDSVKKINDGKNKVILEIPSSEFNDTDYMSFAFRIKNFFKKEFSLYYFRVLLLKEDEDNIIYPLDSNIGNFCTPKKDSKSDENNYFCYCLLKNYYNDFSLNYSISTSNQKDKLAYNYFELINGDIKGYNSIEINKSLFSIEKYNNYESLIKFNFENTKIVNILTTLPNKKKDIYPQIFSTQMFYFKENKNMTFDITNKFTLILNYILGQGKIDCPKFSLTANINFKGKPFLINLNRENNTLKFFFNKAKETEELIFYTKFQQNNEIKEITQGEALREFVNAKKFPIYYFIKNEENTINHMNIHFIIKNIKDKNRNKNTIFEINGYIMNQTEFNTKRKINGEFIELKDPIRGSYDPCFRNGILTINETIEKDKYVLIKIDSFFPLSEDVILIDILTMSEKNGNYILPINNYLTDIYNSSENKNYKILIDKEEKNKEIMVEFYPDFSGMTLNTENDINMTNITDDNGIIQKFRITNFNENDFILKVKDPQGISFGNYIIRYYFTNQSEENYYKLNKFFTIKKGNQKNDIIIKFNQFEITNNSNNTIKETINFKIYGFLFEDENDIKNEFFNSVNSKDKVFKNNAKTYNNLSFNLYFSNVKRRNKNKNNYIFYLYMKIIVYGSESLFNEDFFVYTIPVNLEEELKEKLELIWLIIIGSLVIVIIIIIIIFTIGFIKIKKSNTNLKEKVLAISFTSGKIAEDMNEKNTSKSDEDYENTFI